MSYILIVGNPVDGFKYYGQFSDVDTALNWAEKNLRTEEYWFAELQNPDNGVKF